jgi:membrane-associated phospholipid phosphatase
MQWGKVNFKDRTLILATSYLVATLPQNNTRTTSRWFFSYSFPSGHTATAFAGAEFLWQEYKDVSIWYRICSYGSLGCIMTAIG